MEKEAAVIVLRDVEEEDIAVFFEHQFDPVASEMAAFPARDRDTHMTHWARILADETVIARTIVVGGRVAGNVVSWLKDGRRAIGYWIGRAHWGKGIATTAVNQFLAQVSERPLYAHVATQNVGSIRVLEKCGFTHSDLPVESDPDGIEEILMELKA